MKIKFLYTLVFSLSIFAISLNAQNSLAVTVFHDIDGNGLEDGGEPTIDGVTTAELQLFQDINGSGAIDGGDVEFMHDGGVAGLYTFGTGNVLPDDGYILIYNEVGGPGEYYVTKMINGVGLVDMDNDLDPITNTAGFGLLGDTPEMLIDLGLVIAGNIGDFVWEDLDGDGIQDGGLEVGIDGVSVTLLDAMTMVAVVNDITNVALINPAVTAGGGIYTFDDLAPGQYIVEFSVPAASPDPWYPTQVTVNTDGTDLTNDSDAENNSAAANYLQSHTIILLSDETDEEERIDAGFFQASIIGDWVWEDLNGDGVQDAGEPGIDGVIVSLLDNLGVAAIGADGLAVPDQVTAGGGLYQFTLVAPGDYQVLFNLPAPIGGVPWYPTEFDPAHTDANDPDTDSDANNDPADVPNYLKSHVITIESAETDEELRIDAGFWLPSTIGDLVFCDRNGNGIFEPGGANPEAGVQDMGVQIVDAALAVVNDADGMPLTTSTDAVGNYILDLVPPGEYRVQFLFNGTLADPPYDFTLFEDPDGLGNNTNDSNAEPNEVSPNYGMTDLFTVVSRDPDHEMDWDAGIYKPFLISGIVWLDQGNDNMNTGEGGPDGVIVELFQNGDKIAETPTNGGIYDFIVPPGTGYQLLIGANNFIGGEALSGTSGCPGSSPAGDMVDNDDNGPDTDPGDVMTTTFDLIADCIDNIDQIIEYIDFCFTFECDQPNILASTACDDIPEANFICDVATLGTFCAVMPTPNSPGNQPQPLCPDGGTAHNITWFAFVAYDGNYDITLTPSSCTSIGGNAPGVQIGLYTDCTFTEEVFCNSGCSVDPVSIPSSALTPGQTYYWFIDGCFGSVCSYEVDIVGTAIPPNLTPTDMCIFDTGTGSTICDDVTYCPDTDVTFQVQGLDLTVDFTWTITTLLDGPYVGDTNPTTTDGELIVSFINEGIYRVCLEVIDNGCQVWAGSICRDITIEGLDDEMFDEVFACAPEDFTDITLLMNAAAADPTDPNGDGTIGWQGGTVFTEGPNQFMVTTLQGCEYEQEFELTLFPVSDIGLFDTIVCRDELPLTIDGSLYTELSFAGELVLAIPNLPLVNSFDMNGCDSIIDLNLEILDIFMGELTSGLCTPDGIILNFAYGLEVDGFPSTEAEFITWVWTDPNTDVLVDNFMPLDPLNNIAPFGINGTYTLTATVEKNGKSCVFTYTVEVDFDQFLPPNPEISGPGFDVCEADSIVTYTAINFGDAFTFNWTYPSDVASATISGADGEIITINWSGSAGGAVTLVSENSCGMSEEIDITINVIPQPTPSFTFITEVCIDSCTIIEFVGDATDIGSFSWGFDGGTESNGTNEAGIGPHCVSWPDAGEKTITLSYLDNAGCVSTITTETVTVIAPITPPTINCNPNTGEVSFTWDDVVGATFDVEVTSISSLTGMLHQGILTGTMFTVTGLEDGETVTIILTILTNDACQMVTIASPGCTSQDCIAPPIMLESDTISFCLDANSGVATITATITSGETGTGVYSGTGIVDSLNGIFDPNSALIGINTITYVFMTDDFVPCIGNQTIDIEVKETPVASFTSDVDTICITDQFNLTYNGTSGATMYTWDYGVGGTGTVGPTPSVTFDSPGLKTIELTVIKDDCESEMVSIDVFVQPELTEIVVNCSIQDLDEVGFSWNAILGATGYLVTVNSDAPFETTGTTYGETGLNPNDVVTITVTVLTDSKCPGSTGTAECTATSCPDFVITIDTIPDLCIDDTFTPITLTADASGGDESGTLTWSGTNVTGDQFDPNGLPDGTYEIFVIYEENSCQGDSSMTFNITNNPTAAFSVDNTTICVGSTVNILYEGSQLTNQIITWTSGGEDVTDGANPNEYTATFNTAGTFNIQLDVINGTCMTAPDNASITVEPELVFGDIDCVEGLDSIAFSWFPVDCATDYLVYTTIGSASEVFQGTQTNTDFIVSGLPIGEEVTIRVEAESDCACGNEMNTRLCETKECTQVDLSLSTMDGITEFCISNDLTPIEINAGTDGTDGNGTLTWLGLGVDSDGIFDPLAAGVGTHPIILNFLESVGCPYSDTITFIINENPTVAQQFEEILCFDQATTMLEVIASGGTGPYDITLNGNVGDTLNDVPAGMYNIIVIDDNMCTDSTSVTISQPSEPLPTISGDAELILGDSSTYSIQSNLFSGTTVDSVIWSANGTVICNDAGCFSIGSQSPTETTEYEVTVHYNGGCSVTTTITVEVTEPLEIPIFLIPNIMSPNGDGENDEWQFVTNNDSIIINSVKVFDRWGNMVWSFNGPVQAITNAPIWNGQFNGKVLQPGVYVYFVNFNDDRRQNRIRSGDITIIN